MEESRTQDRQILSERCFSEANFLTRALCLAPGNLSISCRPLCARSRRGIRRHRLSDRDASVFKDLARVWWRLGWTLHRIVSGLHRLHALESPTLAGSTARKIPGPSFLCVYFMAAATKRRPRALPLRLF